MPLLKNNNASHVTNRAVVLDLGDLNAQAERIIDDAREQARRIVDEGRQEAERIVQGASDRGLAEGREIGLVEGREEGRAAGRDEALAQYNEQLQALTGAWSEAIQRWEDDRHAMLLAAREDVLAFALAMARKIVLRIASVDEKVIADQLAETLSLLTRPSSVSIVINPADRPLVEEVLPALLRQLAQCEHADIVEDESVTRGGCIVRTAAGSIDATIENQIDRIAKTLLPDSEPHTETER
jgi:flagellar assembly protein FliH